MLKQLWPVNIWEEELPFSDEENAQLLSEILPEIPKYDGILELHNQQAVIPNLFANATPMVQRLRREFAQRLRVMLEAEGFIKPYEIELEVNAFPRLFTKGMRARPHTHRSVEYVGVYYVDLDVLDDGTDSVDSDASRLLLIDPIAQRSRSLNHNVCYHIIPRPKLLVMHPAYLFHESEKYEGEKNRYLIVINAKVMDRQQARSFIPL